MFVSRNCSFKSLLNVSQKFDIIGCRQNDCWDIKFGAITQNMAPFVNVASARLSPVQMFLMLRYYKSF